MAFYNRPRRLAFPAAHGIKTVALTSELIHCESLLLTFAHPALRAKIRSDEAEDEDFDYSKARATTKYVWIFAVTRRAGANFPDFGVVRR